MRVHSLLEMYVVPHRPICIGVPLYSMLTLLFLRWGLYLITVQAYFTTLLLWKILSNLPAVFLSHWNINSYTNNTAHQQEVKTRLPKRLLLAKKKCTWTVKELN